MAEEMEGLEAEQEESKLLVDSPVGDTSHPAGIPNPPAGEASQGDEAAAVKENNDHDGEDDNVQSAKTADDVDLSGDNPMSNNSPYA